VIFGGDPDGATVGVDIVVTEDFGIVVTGVTGFGVVKGVVAAALAGPKRLAALIY
jgi:hypothetical protein